MLGSYYQADYYQQPQPYTHSDVGEPVPGWGVNPAVAGPARVGVGADLKVMKAIPTMTRLTPITQGGTQGGGDSQEEDKPMSPWVWPAVAALVVGAGTFVAYKQGWL